VPSQRPSMEWRRLVVFRQASVDRAFSEAILSYQIEPSRHKMNGEGLLQDARKRRSIGNRLRISRKMGFPDLQPRPLSIDLSDGKLQRNLGEELRSGQGAGTSISSKGISEARRFKR
jgi:hypothetical protein